MRSPPLRAWQTEAGHRDDVALYFVHAAAEGERRGAPIGVLEHAAEKRPRVAGRYETGGADDLEQEAIAFDEELGAEHLNRGRFRHVWHAGADRPRRAPIVDLQRFELGVDARQVELHPC